MVLPKLLVMNLSGSTFLINSPEFTNFPNLEHLDFEDCTNLLDLHPSIAKLKKLRTLHLKGCSSLHTLPDGIESPYLKCLKFSGCANLNINLECFRDLKRLQHLHLDKTRIKILPHSIGNSPDLHLLDCSECIDFLSIPSSIGQLKKLHHLWLQGCCSLTKLPKEVGLIDSLTNLNVLHSGVRQIPESIVQLRNLKELRFRGFGGTTPSNQLSIVPETISSCFSLKQLHIAHSDIECLPASIKDLRNLEEFRLCHCNNLQELHELLPNVDEVWVHGCGSLENICCLPVCGDVYISIR